MSFNMTHNLIIALPQLHQENNLFHADPGIILGHGRKSHSEKKEGKENPSTIHAGLLRLGTVIYPWKGECSPIRKREKDLVIDAATLKIIGGPRIFGTGSRSLFYRNFLDTGHPHLPTAHRTGLLPIPTTIPTSLFSGSITSGAFFTIALPTSIARGALDVSIPITDRTGLHPGPLAIRTDNPTRFPTADAIFTLTEDLCIRIPEIFAQPVVLTGGQ
jgi:hypothetical protein